MLLKDATSTLLNGEKAVVILPRRGYSVVEVSPQWATPMKNESKQRVMVADSKTALTALPPPTVYQNLPDIKNTRVSFSNSGKPNVSTAYSRCHRHENGVQPPKKHVEYLLHLNNMNQLNGTTNLKFASRRSSMPMMDSANSSLPSSTTAVKFLITSSKPLSFERRCRSSIGRSSAAAAAAVVVVTAPWKLDQSLLQSKVYRARLDKAATALQKYVRRWLCRFALAYAATAAWKRRRHVAALRLQAILRRWHERRQTRRSNAATTIQCAVRSYLARLQRRVYQLQRQLQSLQMQGHQKLEPTGKHKKRELRALRRQERSAACERRSAIDRAMKTMYKLERENKRLKARQERWQRKCQEMLDHNQRLKASLRDTSTMTEQMQNKTIAPLLKAITQWQTILAEFEQRPQLFHDALQRQGEMCQFEEQVHAIYRRYILNMVQTIEADCTDDDLVNIILNIVTHVLIEGR